MPESATYKVSVTIEAEVTGAPTTSDAISALAAPLSETARVLVAPKAGISVRRPVVTDVHARRL